MPTTSQNGQHEALYIKFKSLPDGALNEDGKPALNKYSSIITRGHDSPGAQVFIISPFTDYSIFFCANISKAMLYAAGVQDRHTMKNAPQVGIASVWWEGNPCK